MGALCDQTICHYVSRLYVGVYHGCGKLEQWGKVENKGKPHNTTEPGHFKVLRSKSLLVKVVSDNLPRGGATLNGINGLW